MGKKFFGFRWIIGLFFVSELLGQGKEWTEAQLDSIAKASYLKRMAEEEARGMQSAQQAISKARHEGVKEIHIRGFTKNEIPDISDLKHVESFSCTYCKALNLSKLFEQLAVLPNLKKLALVGCQIKKVPEEIYLLKNLEELSLKDNPITQLPQALSSLKKLTTLNLQHCGYLPDEQIWDVLDTSSVEHLNLSACELFGISDAIGKALSLKSLDLSINDIRTLPASFSQLKNLRRLKLSHNNNLDLAAIFSVLRSNAQLEELDLSECYLETLPVELCDVLSLKNLILRGNQITSLPECFGRLIALERLDLGGLPFANRNNRIERLPVSFSQLSNLTWLNLHANKLTSLEPIEGCKKLEYLNVSTNELEVFPPQLCELRNLKNLDLSLNRITGIPVCIGKMASLEYLNMNGFFFNTPERKLKTIPREICRLEKLNTLSLKDNVIDSLPSCIGQLKNLEHLDLRDNLLSSLPDSIIYLRKLKKLLLKANELSSIPTEIYKLDALREFDLSMNPRLDFEKVFELLKKMQRLEILDLSYNKLNQEKVLKLKEQMPNTKISHNEF
ncbi:MAG: leucine-rich repeat domain-containing protein [Chitinophagales bacterium]|nr:leucine-rich repeat domain-containing protein [Chitinophagales bacterium]